MDVTDTCCKEINTKICNHLAFLRICAFTHAYNTVFFTTDGTNFCFQRHSMLSNDLNQFFCFCYVLFDRIMGTIKHDRCETCFYAFQASFIAAVVKVKCNRNSDVQFFQHTFNHTNNCFVTCHVFSCTFGYTKDNRGVEFLCGKQDCFCPLKVVNVELTNCIMTSFCFFQHF